MTFVFEVMTDATKMWSTLIYYVLLMPLLVTLSEALDNFKILFADEHMETALVYRDVRSAAQCATLCVRHRTDELPCEAFHFASKEEPCELYTGRILEVLTSSKIVYKYETFNSSTHNNDTWKEDFSLWIPSVELNYYQARDYCLSHRSYLLHIDSTDVYDRMKAIIPQSGKSYWIGANDLEKKGRYVCERDGLPMDRSKLLFGPGEPNNYRGREHCLTVIADQMLLNDNSCNFYFNFICEKRLIE